MPEEIYLSFRDIRKIFPGVVALDGVNLDVYRGEIHALLGENGAGKSTLMNILYGLYHQDGGEIFLKGEKYEHNTPKNAILHGIGMIHQHFMLIPNFTVLENIILGQTSPNPPKMEKEYFRKEIFKVADKFGIKIDLDLLVEEVSVGMQQKIEILKALYKGAELLILDEPTSVLTPQESQELFKMLDDLNKKGTTIIFISHKLNEVMQISDRISVLRDGELIATVSKSETDHHELSKLMVGREVEEEYQKEEAKYGEDVLILEKISLIDHHNHDRRLLKEISLKVCEGEIVGIAGVDENGQKELAEIISGLRKPSSGKISMFGRDVTHATTHQLIEMGMSYIPADRRNEGLVLEFSVAENTILETNYQKPFTKGISLQKSVITKFAQDLVREYDVRTPSVNVPVRNLSGGNQQKVIIGREFSKKTRFLLVVQPTWGLDVGAIEYVHHKLLEAREKGISVLLISTDLEEVRKLSDRILVIYEGEIVGQADTRTSVSEIGLMMAGSKKQTVSL
ncbi:MAG: ABC transporter ATP-binding protein [Anaerolineaceae bacterium]|nr:ABC transporter ATP-binding protein [Anaerolineaceae bacterium]